MHARFAEFLDAHAARYDAITHAEAFTSQEEAAAAHVSGWSWAKVIIVKAPNELGMAVLPACCSVDLDRLKGLVGRGALRLATVEEILAVFAGCELGAIPPFGRLFGVGTFAEEALVNQREITMPAGDHRTAVRMRAAEYLRLAQPRTGHFAVHAAQGFPVHPRLGARMSGRRAG
jgi:Ala-tRNA(Pro) deacylase